MASYLITGTSRGLGLTLTAMLAAKPASEVSIIYATYRTKTEALQKLVSNFPGRVEALPLDAISKDSINLAVSQVEKSLAGKGLDVLINNAGLPSWTPEGIQAMDDLDTNFNANVTSTHLVTAGFLPLLKKGALKKVINMTSTMGSMALAHFLVQKPTPAYKISKAALNMLTMQYSLDFKDEGFTIVAISPGWLKTDLGGSNADLPVETGAKATLDIIFRVGKEDNGKFLNIEVPGWDYYDGKEAPW